MCVKYIIALSSVHCEFHPLNPDFQPFIVFAVPYPRRLNRIEEQETVVGRGSHAK
jgi:hypothetical protein